MAITVTHQDPRYPTLRRSRNLRLPPSEADFASRIELCENTAEVAEALQRIVNAGLRPTVRSGGHCYEDFVVNNPGGAILDLSLQEPHSAKDGTVYKISAGRQLGDVYLDLYKRYGVTIPAGTCYAVGAGGHISGGGYGLLSRLHGLTVDWLSAVDILTVDANGKVVLRHVDKQHDPDLFRACRGAGGGNFGVVTTFFFDKLPPAPQEVVHSGLSFDWTTMTEERFVTILTTYGHYWESRGKDPDTYGLFSILDISHASTKRLGLSLQFCNPDGTCKDLSVVNEFLDLFSPCKPTPGAPAPTGQRAIPGASGPGEACPGLYPMSRRLWLDATIGDSGGEGSGRAKYKSSYMKTNFTPEEAKCMYKHMTREVSGVDLRGFFLAIDSYGGATNRANLAEETSIWQRSSTMKLQFQSYWQNAEDDAGRLKWLKDFYADLYTNSKVDPRYASTPYPGEHYEGCYINYPDSDMLAYSFWPQLYYGDQGLYEFLQGVKRRYDPNNVFHHAMSVRT
ncbi:FAD-binding oxidoreductase [Alloacidobacterium dinghuense]|uniref:FAD-binding oxidoreductase n=1 Tax=Alloacidobacterium dinghuense TaxID=2763107 RepID=A0A7G8BDF9_9BACT|nr:BBE domain-containing protein [Alloacidobacterium dinghuense]QNI30579.1 FAD-binding oxidoreductase [Alloacidobacterium dinghuense]